jgi:hypothetical protein
MAFCHRLKTKPHKNQTTPHRAEQTEQYIMKTKLMLLTAALGLAAATSGRAQTTFIFDDGSSTGAAGLALESFTSGVDAASMSLNTSGTYTLNGITLSAGTDFGDFNLTNSGFGPDQAGSADDSDTFDTGNGNESMVFSFDTAGTFNSIDFALLNDTPEFAVLSFAGGSTFNLTDGPSSTIAVSGNDFFGGVNESFTSGQLVTLSISGGSDFTLENFTVTAIPEPSTIVLVAMTGLAAIGILRRQRKK